MTEWLSHEEDFMVNEVTTFNPCAGEVDMGRGVPITSGRSCSDKEEGGELRFLVWAIKDLEKCTRC